MNEVIIEKEFQNIFDVDGIFKDSGQNCFLWVRYKAIEGHIVKKKVKTSEKVKLKSIKLIEEATFGPNEKNRIDVKELLLQYKENYSISVNFEKINNKFFSFCNTLLKVICPRCYNSYAKTKLNPHNHGYMNIRIAQAPNNTWFNIFDGIIKCFIAFVINEDINIIKKKKERYIESFSDLIVNKNYNNLDHFKYANIIYDYFMKISRSIEEYKQIEKKMKFSTLNTIKTFFKYQYPVLKYLYQNKNSIFIRHGLEKKIDDYKRNMIYPHNDTKHGWRIHNITSLNGKSIPSVLPVYPIEVDTLPFKKCASHSSKEIYGNVKGFIAFPLFKKLGGKIAMRYENDNNVMPRDHLFAESEINIQNWIFTYRKTNEPSLKANVKKAVNALVNQGIPVMDEAIIPNFTHVLQAIENKFILLH